jgi:hypothetical protein
MKRHLQTLAAALLVCGFAVAQYPTRARFGGVPFTTADAISATGWTYNGTQSLATKDVSVPTNNRYYMDGATRVVSMFWNGTNILLTGTPAPGSDQGYNLGSTSLRWSRAYLGSLAIGASGALTLSNEAPVIAAACTSPTVTNGNTVSFQMDVGTSCTGVSTVTLTLAAAAAGWECHGRNITGGLTRQLRQTGAISTTSVTLRSTDAAGAATDLVDGDDLGISCMAR